MKSREFNKVLKELSDSKKVKSVSPLGKTITKTVFLLSKVKVSEADNVTKNKVIDYLVRKRGPIVVDFINDETDISWLSCCGYLYKKQGKVFQFLCTSENLRLIS